MAEKNQNIKINIADWIADPHYNGGLAEKGDGNYILADRVSLSSKEETMPTYEYLCGQCGHEFTIVISLGEYEAGKVNCPKCNSPEVKQQMTAFISKTSRKS